MKEKTKTPLLAIIVSSVLEALLQFLFAALVDLMSIGDLPPKPHPPHTHPQLRYTHNALQALHHHCCHLNWNVYLGSGEQHDMK